MEDSDITSDTHITPDLFWHAVNILITKPHVVNKRLWGCKILGRFTCPSSKVFNSLLLPLKIKDLNNIDAFLRELSSHVKCELVPVEGNAETEIILTELLPKNYGENHAFQLIYLQKSEITVTFYDVSPIGECQNLSPNFSYRLLLQNNVISLSCDDGKIHIFYFVYVHNIIFLIIMKSLLLRIKKKHLILQIIKHQNHINGW